MVTAGRNDGHKACITHEYRKSPEIVRRVNAAKQQVEKQRNSLPENVAGHQYRGIAYKCAIYKTLPHFSDTKAATIHYVGWSIKPGCCPTLLFPFACLCGTIRSDLAGVAIIHEAVVQV